MTQIHIFSYPNPANLQDKADSELSPVEERPEHGQAAILRNTAIKHQLLPHFM